MTDLDACWTCGEPALDTSVLCGPCEALDNEKAEARRKDEEQRQERYRKAMETIDRLIGRVA